MYCLINSKMHYSLKWHKMLKKFGTADLSHIHVLAEISFRKKDWWFKPNN